MAFLFVTWFASFQVFASPFFTPLRDDLNVPHRCRDMKLSFYSFPAEKVFVGRKGATTMGFTMEYPIARDHATILWKYFRSVVLGNPNNSLKNKIFSNQTLKRDHDIIEANYREHGFDFTNEGEILELLVIEDLYEEFPENEYYITGGVEYHEEYSPKTIGEVDLFVGRRSTCESVVVGEVKLGTQKMLSKAKQQISRFENFLMDHNTPGFGGEYQPQR